MINKLFKSRWVPLQHDSRTNLLSKFFSHLIFILPKFPQKHVLKNNKYKFYSIWKNCF